MSRHPRWDLKINSGTAGLRSCKPLYSTYIYVRGKKKKKKKRKKEKGKSRERKNTGKKYTRNKKKRKKEKKKKSSYSTYRSMHLGKARVPYISRYICTYLSVL